MMVTKLGQGFAMPPNGMLTRDDNLAGKFRLPGLPTPTPLPLTTPPTESPEEINELFKTFLVWWKIWRETMNYQGVIIKIKV
jgi:hypothetical protein